MKVVSIRNRWDHEHRVGHTPAGSQTQTCCDQLSTSKDDGAVLFWGVNSLKNHLLHRIGKTPYFLNGLNAAYI
jgi:hypothetical protein